MIGGKPKNEPGEEQPAEERSYYYDDAHGYEDFNPQADEEEVEKDEEEFCDD
jgi:hypothetical protein